MKRYIKSSRSENKVYGRSPRRVFSNNPETRANVAMTTSSPELLEMYAYDPDPQVRRYVAYNDDTPIDTLAVLSDDADAEVRGGVARRANLPLDFFNKLSQDNNRGVRFSVASNHSTPPDVLRTLARDDYRIRIAVAGNPNTPPDVLLELSQEGGEEVLYDLAHNWHTPPEAYLNIARQLPGSRAWDYGYADTVLRMVQYNNSIPSEALEIIADKYKLKDILLAIIDNENVTAELLKRLSQSGNNAVKTAAENKLLERGEL